MFESLFSGTNIEELHKILGVRSIFFLELELVKLKVFDLEVLK